MEDIVFPGGQPRVRASPPLPYGSQRQQERYAQRGELSNSLHGLSPREAQRSPDPTPPGPPNPGPPGPINPPLGPSPPYELQRLQPYALSGGQFRARPGLQLQYETTRQPERYAQQGEVLNGPSPLYEAQRSQANDGYRGSLGAQPRPTVSSETPRQQEIHAQHGEPSSLSPKKQVHRALVFCGEKLRQEGTSLPQRSTPLNPNAASFYESQGRQARNNDSGIQQAHPPASFIAPRGQEMHSQHPAPSSLPPRSTPFFDAPSRTKIYGEYQAQSRQQGTYGQYLALPRRQETYPQQEASTWIVRSAPQYTGPTNGVRVSASSIANLPPKKAEAIERYRNRKLWSETDMTEPREREAVYLEDSIVVEPRELTKNVEFGDERRSTRSTRVDCSTETVAPNNDVVVPAASSANRPPPKTRGRPPMQGPKTEAETLKDTRIAEKKAQKLKRSLNATNPYSNWPSIHVSETKRVDQAGGSGIIPPSEAPSLNTVTMVRRELALWNSSSSKKRKRSLKEDLEGSESELVSHGEEDSLKKKKCIWILQEDLKILESAHEDQSIRRNFNILAAVGVVALHAESPVLDTSTSSPAISVRYSENIQEPSTPMDTPAHEQSTSPLVASTSSPESSRRSSENVQEALTPMDTSARGQLPLASSPKLKGSDQLREPKSYEPGDDELSFLRRGYLDEIQQRSDADDVMGEIAPLFSSPQQIEIEKGTLSGNLYSTDLDLSDLLMLTGLTNSSNCEITKLTSDNRFDDNEDGKVIMMGNGESYRPSGRAPPRADNFRSDRDRSPLRADTFRSDRDRSPPRRRRTPPLVTDTYHPPARSPRRQRSRSPPYRGRDRSPNGDWRSRPRSRPRARSPLGRSPRGFSPRRDDGRRERPRSPRRDDRRRSRSPYDRDRVAPRVRSPLPSRRSPPPGPRGSTRRSRSPDRRDDRASGPASASWRNRSVSPANRESGHSSVRTSGENSRRSSPPVHPSRQALTQSATRDAKRSPPRNRSPQMSLAYRDRESARTTPRERSPVRASAPRSPPRGPASSRAPPTGPSGNRNFSGPTRSPLMNHAVPFMSAHNRLENGPANPPTGPRAQASSGFNRGPNYMRGGRGSFGTERQTRPDISSWGGALPSRTIDTSAKATIPATRSVPTPSPSTPSAPSAPISAPTGPSGIPTGPRAGPSIPSRPNIQHSSTIYSRSSISSASGPRIHPAMANLQPIIPGGRIDPSASGIPADITMRLKKREEEAEVLREELMLKQEKLRKGLKGWDRLSREATGMALKTELSSRHVRMLAGEGAGGNAF